MPIQLQPHIARRVGLIGVMLIGLIDNFSWGIIMPSMWQYMESLGGTEPEFGIVMGLFSAAQLVGLPLVGYWGDKRTIKEAMLGTLAIGIVGQLLYCMAQPTQFKWLILMGRLLAGCSAANASLTGSYVQAVVSEEDRTGWMGKIQGVASVGLITGPAINIALAHIDFSIGSAKFDIYTLPGYAMAFFLMVMFIYFALFFHEPPHVQHPKDDYNPRTVYLKNFWKFTVQQAIGVSFVLGFVGNFLMALLETIVTPITTEMYHWDPFKNSVFFAALAFESIIIVVLVIFLASKRMADRTLITTGMVFLGIALTFMTIMWGQQYIPVWSFCVGAAVLFLGMPILGVTGTSFFSKQIEVAVGSGRQGVFLGLFMVAGAFGRILGPVFGGSALTFPNPRIIYIVSLSIWAFSMFLIVIAWKRLNPQPGKLERVTSDLEVGGDTEQQQQEHQHLTSGDRSEHLGEDSTTVEVYDDTVPLTSGQRHESDVSDDDDTTGSTAARPGEQSDSARLVVEEVR